MTSPFNPARSPAADKKHNATTSFWKFRVRTALIMIIIHGHTRDTDETSTKQIQILVNNEHRLIR